MKFWSITGKAHLSTNPAKMFSLVMVHLEQNWMEVAQLSLSKMPERPEFVNGILMQYCICWEMKQEKNILDQIFLMESGTLALIVTYLLLSNR